MYAIVHLFHCLLFFMLICVHYCIDVVAVVVVVKINSIQFNQCLVCGEYSNAHFVSVVFQNAE